MEWIRGIATSCNAAFFARRLVEILGRRRRFNLRFFPIGFKFLEFPEFPGLSSEQQGPLVCVSLQAANGPCNISMR